MSEISVKSRPLSPHLQIYKPQITSALSILHRITGSALLLVAFLVVLWFLGAATGPEAFARIDGFMTSWLGILILFGSSIALWYHFFNGIRHLWWDTGRGFELDQVRKSGIAVLVATAVATVMTWLLLAG